MIFCRRYSGITEMDSRLEEKVRRRCCASDGLKEAALHLNCTVGWRRGKTSPALAAGSWDVPAILTKQLSPLCRFIGVTEASSSVRKRWCAFTAGCSASAGTTG